MRRRSRELVLIGLAAFACTAEPANARVQAGDSTATHKYLEARIALDRTHEQGGSAELAAIKALAAQVKRECPGVLSGAPPHVKGEKTSESGLQVSEELLVATSGVAEHLEHPADVRFARLVRRLRWSNGRLTKLLRSLALEQAEQSAIPTPDLCADMKFWVESGYTAVSSGTKEYLHRLTVVTSITQIEQEPHEAASNLLDLNALVAHRLRPYEDRADRKLAKEALPPEGSLSTALESPEVQAFLAAEGEVLAALGRTPAPAAQDQ